MSKKIGVPKTLKQELLKYATSKNDRVFINSVFTKNGDKVESFFYLDIIYFIKKHGIKLPYFSNMFSLIPSLFYPTKMNPRFNLKKFDETFPITLQKHQFNHVKKFIYNTSAFFNKGIFIADEPGMGKTITSLACMSAYGEKPTCLIICPNSLKRQWYNTCSKIFNYRIEVDNEAPICITNPENLQNIEVSFDFVIVDEAHMYTNIETENFLKIAGKTISSKYVILLSATPFREKVEDAFAYYCLLTKHTDNVNDMVRFRKIESYQPIKYTIFRKINPFISKASKESTKEKIKTEKSLNIVIIKTNKPFLPTKSDLERIKAIIDKYKKIVSKDKILSEIVKRKEKNSPYLKNIKNSSIRKIMDVLTSKNPYTVLYSRIYNNYVKNLSREISKKQEIKNILDKHKKTIIFTKYKSTAKTIYKNLGTSGYDGFLITGETGEKDRLKLIEKFKHSNFKFIVATYKVLSLGFNIECADSIIIHDAPYRPDTFKQAIGRATRMTSPSKKLKVYILKTSSPSWINRDINILSKYSNIVKSLMKKIDNKEV